MHPEHAPPTPDAPRTPAARKRAQRPAPADASLRAILTAVRALLRSKHSVSLPAQGIDLMFDLGVVVRCRSCRVNWTVGRRQFPVAAWWSCPRGCRPAGEAAGHSG